MSYLRPEQIADEIMNLYEQHGAEEYAGEKVSQTEHMSQAAGLAMEEGYDEEVVLAAFLHDIGHLLPVHSEEESMNGFGTIDHEIVGAYYLGKLGFSEKLCSLIKSHVDAKRYLTFKYPDYYGQLSEASKKTLEYQGGRMSAGEAEAFEADELFPLYIKMRKWDEAAKDTDKISALPEKFREMMIRHLENRATA
jgi:2-amino-1-hydroxyethylphosphonate dioxygenase (glycine-forming)